MKNVSTNTSHGITPRPAGKSSIGNNPILAFLELSRKLNDEQPSEAPEVANHYGVSLEAMPELIKQLEDKMKTAAANLDFEAAASLRDQIKKLRQKLVGST